MTIYYHVYLQQLGKYLEVDLIGSRATNQKQEKFSCLGKELNPGPFNPESFALPSDPSCLLVSFEELILTILFHLGIAAIFHAHTFLCTSHSSPSPFPLLLGAYLMTCSFYQCKLSHSVAGGRYSAMMT